MHILLNGEMLDETTPVLTVQNRAFRYGDALFETLRVVNGKILFLADHLARLQEGMKFLRFELPSDNTTVSFWEQKIKALLQQNNVAGDARVRISLFRNLGGFYIPEDNSVSYLIETMDLPDEHGYRLNNKGYTIDVYPEIKIQQNKLGQIKSANSLPYVMAGIYKKEKGLDDCLLLNEAGFVAEAISSNVFVVKNGTIYTPSLEEGCIAGIMRQKIVDIATENRLAVHEMSLSVSVLLNVDELFLTNTIRGITWVGAYKGKRYFNDTAKLLMEKLNSAI